MTHTVLLPKQMTILFYSRPQAIYTQVSWWAA